MAKKRRSKTSNFGDKKAAPYGGGGQRKRASTKTAKGARKQKRTGRRGK